MPRHLTLLERVWKYTAFGLSTIVFEEANPIFGGIAARHARADFRIVVLAVVLGSWIASITLYYIGLLRIDWVRDRWPDKHALLDEALAKVRRNPWLSSLAVRFAYGLRLPLPIACGAARVPISLYLVGSFISSMVWSLAFGWFGLVSGGAAIALLHFTERVEVRLGIIALVLILVLFVLMRRRVGASKEGA